MGVRSIVVWLYWDEIGFGFCRFGIVVVVGLREREVKRM